MDPLVVDTSGTVYSVALNVPRANTEDPEMVLSWERTAAIAHRAKADADGYRPCGVVSIRWSNWVQQDEEGRYWLSSETDGTHRMLVVESQVRSKES